MKINNESNRVFIIDENNTVIAEITFPFISENVVNINHTFVDPLLRGKGIAGKLIEAAVKNIELRKLKIVATCSYAVKWFEEHPEYQSLLN